MGRWGERLSGAFDRLPIRIRLAFVSACLTFVILCAFAVTVGGLTVRRLRSDFNRQVEQTSRQLSTQLNVVIDPVTFRIAAIQPPLNDLPGVPEHSVIKLYTIGGALIAQTPAQERPQPGAARGRRAHRRRLSRGQPVRDRARARGRRHAGARDRAVRAADLRRRRHQRAREAAAAAGGPRGLGLLRCSRA